MLRGRIPASELAEEGRALAFADDPAWSSLVGRLDSGAPVPAEVVSAMVEVLRRWARHWAARPVAVVPVPSRHAAPLITSLAAAIGEVGRLPVLDALEADGPPPPSGTSSGPRADAIVERLRARPDVDLPAGPLLLVDDEYATGWTATIAAAVLRRAGSGPVHPFVIHQRP